MRHFSRAIIVVASIALISLPTARSAAAADRPATGKIMIAPFTAMSASAPQPGILKSIQDRLVADLAPFAPAGVVSSDLKPGNARAAIEAAAGAGARYVAMGEVRATSRELHVTGKVLDVQSGKTVVTFQSTGPASAPSTIEDAIATQVRHGLGWNAAVTVQPAPAAGAMQAAAMPMTLEQQGAENFLTNPYAPLTGFWGELTPAANDGWSVINGASDFGNGGSIGYHHFWNPPSNATWNGSEAFGLANSISGVPLGPMNTPSISDRPGISLYGTPVYSGNNIPNPSGFSIAAPIPNPQVGNSHPNNRPAFGTPSIATQVKQH